MSEGIPTDDRSAGGPSPDASTHDHLAAARTASADHRTALAAERTLYAVLRTGFSIAAGGTVVVELLGGDWPSWLKAVLAGTLVVAGYTMIIAGLRRYEAVARAVAATSDGDTGPLSPILVRAITVAVQVALAVVIIVFLLGWFSSG